MFGEDLVAKHFAKQQQYLRRNTQTINSDDEWFAAAARIRQSCGALVLWRRNDCSGSRFLAPALYELSADNERAPILFFEVNIDLCKRARAEYDIDLTPAFTTFLHGKPIAGSHGISKHFIQEQFESLCNDIETCAQCGRNNRYGFMIELDSAIATGRLSCGGSLSVSGTRVPSTRCSLELDLSSSHESIAAFRIPKLLEQLSAEAQTDHAFASICNTRPVIEFLEECDDEGLLLDGLIAEVQRWLTQKHDGLDPSLWNAEQYSTRSRIVRHALYRRAARVELWVLMNLQKTSSGSQIAESNDRKVREMLSVKWEELQRHAPCSRACMQCKLPCGRMVMHTGACDCGTDHQCHCCTRGSGEQCELQAGHGGSHLFPRPPSPPSPPQVESSVASLPALPSQSSSATTLSPLGRLSTQFSLVIQPTPLLARMSQHRNSQFSSRKAEPTPKVTIDQLRNSWSGTGKDSECSVCYEPLSSSSIEELHCKHAFHPACIGAWAHLKKSCPMCRFPVDVNSLSSEAQAAAKEWHQSTKWAAPRAEVGTSSSLPVVQSSQNTTVVQSSQNTTRAASLPTPSVPARSLRASRTNESQHSSSSRNGQRRRYGSQRSRTNQT